MSRKIVQQCCERDAEQPNTVALRGDLGEKRFHRLRLVFEVLAATVVSDMDDLVGSNMITVGHKHSVVALSVLVSRWDGEGLGGGVEATIDPEMSTQCTGSVWPSQWPFDPLLWWWRAIR